jgi:hypothetical protein
VSWVRDVEVFLDVHNGAVTGIASIFIAAFTIVLAFVTRRQASLTYTVAEAAKRSAAIAERSLADLERPYVVVEINKTGISLGDPNDPNEGTTWGYAE